MPIYPHHCELKENHALKNPYAAVQPFRLQPLAQALLAALVPLAPLAAWAADPVTTPSAGTLLNQTTPPAPTPSAPRATGLTLERSSDASGLSSSPFEVKALQISGNTQFDTATLMALVANAQGKTMTLADLERVVARITAHYRRAGFTLARAIIPAQTIQNGVVRVEVLEAKFGAVRVFNRSQVSNGLLNDALSPLRTGELIAQRALDSTLLLINDLPGVNVSAVLKPGETVGSSDLAVLVAPGPSSSGQGWLDDHGNRFTGRTHLGAGVSAYNLLHRGDTLSATVLTSGTNLNFGRVGYDARLNGRGTRAGVALSSLHYKLAGPASDLQAHGTANVLSANLASSLHRALNANLDAQVQVERLSLRDDVDATAIRNSRHVSALSFSMTADASERWIVGGSQSALLALTFGQLSFDSTAAAAADAATAKAAGSFAKTSVQFSHTQALGLRASVSASLAMQWSGNNLDPSQKMSLGGPHSVRAYDSGTVSGDSGYVLKVEYKQRLSSANSEASVGQVQGALFLDTGHVTVNRKPWQDGANSVSVSGLGAGLNWAGGDGWRATASLAKPIGKSDALAGNDRSTRVWVEVARSF